MSSTSLGMASVAPFVFSTPPIDSTSPSLPQHAVMATSAPSTTRVTQHPAHAQRKGVTLSPTQLRASRTFKLSLWTATTLSRETTIHSHREMQEIRQRTGMLKGCARKKRCSTAPETVVPSETKANKIKHRNKPSPPLAPRITRLPTPDLSDLEGDEFCACCDAVKQGRGSGSDDRQRQEYHEDDKRTAETEGERNESCKKPVEW